MIEYYELTDDDNIPYRCEVEMDWIEQAPQENRPQLLWLFVKAAEPLSESFRAFSDDLRQSLEASLDAVFGGSIAKEGWVEFYFYAPDAKRFENVSSEVMTRHGGFAHERGASRDGKWEMYFDRLCPDAYALLNIQNRQTIEALIEAGDDLSLPREVEHYLFFQTKSALERAITLLSAQGFVFKEHVTEDESDYAYGAVLVKTEPITPDEVEETTSLLFETALQQHGIYEGWSTVLGNA